VPLGVLPESGRREKKSASWRYAARTTARQGVRPLTLSISTTICTAVSMYVSANGTNTLSCNGYPVPASLPQTHGVREVKIPCHYLHMASKKGQIAGHTLGNLSFGNKLPLPESSAADHVRLFLYFQRQGRRNLDHFLCPDLVCFPRTHGRQRICVCGVMPLALMLSAAREVPSVNENWARTFLSLFALGIV
jgi:hypothetical protein